jgi:hypothetical protein
VTTGATASRLAGHSHEALLPRSCWSWRATSTSFRPADRYLTQPHSLVRLPRDQAEDAEHASRFLADAKACLNAALARATQLRSVWTELLWFAIVAA